ncbi:hypothetical protein [Streptomyces sp. MST-110588]|uniref:hypothetical protein n=1 Tax=Streptomyces sp. MST-110588 TaxID=2833628 RepID=UPI001F5D0484|nr:hypothetical protein [Streptomyces sp. MST-110588]UNO42350.1 hypothetical protein KGS77_26035 [Streptomyces sp. MST-110588]
MLPRTPSRRGGRTPAAVAITATATAVVAVTAVAAPAPTPAAVRAKPAVNVSCRAGGSAAFTPGLLPAPAPRNTRVRFDGSCHPCTGATPTGRQLTGARFTASYSAPMSCTVGGSRRPSTGSGTIEWRTRAGRVLTSTLSLTVTGPLFHTATVNGKVTRGAYTGGTLHGEFEAEIVKQGINCRAQSPGGGLRGAGYTGHFTFRK